MTAPIRPRPLAATLLLAASLGACGTASTPRPSASSPAVDAPLRAELVRLGAEDQAAREGFGAAIARNDTAYGRRLLAGDSARTERLRAIIRAHGWPGRALAGDDGAHAAWLLLQHTSSTELQRSLLPTLWAAARRGEIATSDVATLDDRVRVHEGKRQRYGTSFKIREGRLIADPIEDLRGLDARRAAAGLPPMGDYVRLLAELYGMPVTWPPAP